MDTKELYREILNEHNLNPVHKVNMDSPTFCLEGVNPSCGDQITLQLKMDGDKITDASFTGSGCAVSQASADMMADLVIGKTKEEALRLADIFDRMIKGSRAGGGGGFWGEGERGREGRRTGRTG